MKPLEKGWAGQEDGVVVVCVCVWDFTAPRTEALVKAHLDCWFLVIKRARREEVSLCEGDFLERKWGILREESRARRGQEGGSAGSGKVWRMKTRGEGHEAMWELLAVAHCWGDGQSSLQETGEGTHGSQAGLLVSSELHVWYEGGLQERCTT